MFPIVDCRAGARVQLRNGFYATLTDNRPKHHVREAKVEGRYTEVGSVYSTDIVWVRVSGDSMTVDANWSQVAHTKPQLEAATLRKSMGF